VSRRDRNPRDVARDPRVVDEQVCAARPHFDAAVAVRANDITQAVSIIAPPGIYAGISVFAGDDGITVNAGASDKVTLRGLAVNGRGGNRGIVYAGGAELEIDRCIVTGMTADGMEVGAGSGITTIADTVVERNGSNGIEFDPRGSGISKGLLTSVRVTSNHFSGLLVDAGGQVQVRTSVFQHKGDGIGVQASVANNSSLDITYSLLSDNSVRGILVATQISSVAFVQAAISDNVITNNSLAGVVVSTVSPSVGGAHAVLTRNTVRGLGAAKGILANNANTKVLLEGNVVSQTSVGIQVQNSAVVRSRRDNVVDDNTTNQSGAVTAADVL
jgi:hypothetical protein